MLSSIPQEDSSVIIEKHLHNNVTNIENRFETLKNEIVEMVEKKKPSTISKSASNESKADKVKSKSDVNVDLSKGSKEPIVRHLSPAPRKVSPLPDFPLIGYNK
jgi:predicted RecB family endonuclease